MSRLVKSFFSERSLSVNTSKREHGSPQRKSDFIPRCPRRELLRRLGYPRLPSVYGAREGTMRVSQAFYLIRTALKNFRARSFGETPKTLLW